MLGKLLKYDLKYMIKNMSVFYILAIVFAIITRILLSVEQTIIATIIKNITTGCMFAMVANIIINTLMRSWVRFRDSIYKDEGYLTNTLPVTKNQIYNSKFIQALIFFIVSFIIVLLSIAIAYLNKDRWELLKNYIKGITTGLEISSGLFISGFLGIVFLEMFNALQCGFFGIILGHKQNNNRVALSVLFGFIAYFASQSIVLALVFIVGLFNESVMGLFTNTVLLETGALKILFALSMILYIIIIWIMSIICKKLFNKGVNLE